MGTQFLFGMIKTILEIDSGGNDYTIFWMYPMPLNCTLKIV